MRWILLNVLLLVSIALGAAESILKFDNEKQQQTYQQLITELRCPKCLNQSIADSNAGISEDLRNLVYEKVKQGQSAAEIKTFLRERYGDFILYKPEVAGSNLILWFGPLVLLLITVAVLWIRFRARLQLVESKLTDQEQQKLQQLLKKDADIEVEKSNSRSE